MPISTPPGTNKNYDPRLNSPIKAPVVEYCITCGQPLPSKVIPLTNDMSQYLNGDDMKGIRIVSSIEDTLEIKGVTFYRIKGYDHEHKPLLAVKPVSKEKVSIQTQETK